MKQLFNDYFSPHLQKKFFYWCGISFSALLLLCFFTIFLNFETFWVLDIWAPHAVFMHTFGLIGLCWLLHKFSNLYLPYRDGVLQTTVQIFLSLFFSLFSLLGVYFDAYSPYLLTRILSHSFSLAFFLIALMGGTLFYFLVIRSIWHMKETPKKTDSESGFLSRFFGEHLFRNSLLVLLIFWLPQYIIRFPGAVPYDAWQSLAMMLGYTEITTQHPMIWNILFGVLTQFGTTIGIPWLAPLVICLTHYILALLLFPYVISSLKKFGTSNGFLMGSLLFFAVIPQIKLYLSTAYNDFIFCLAFLLLTIEFVYYLYDRTRYFSGCRHLLLTAMASLFTIFRYNGFYTMLVVIGVVLIRELVLLCKKNAKLSQTILFSIALILPLCGGQILQSNLNRIYDAKNISSRAMLSLPIQQSVRCLIAYGDDIPKEDYDALHTILTWTDEEYAQTYNPRNFDDVKESFKTDASKEELTAFVKAWGNLLTRYPRTCFMATAHQNYYLFSPLAHNARYYLPGDHTEYTMERYQFDATPYLFDFPLLKVLAKLLSFLYHGVFPNLPFLGLLVTQGLYTLLLFIICLRSLFLKDRRILILTVALLVILGITLIGPAVFNHPRYTYLLVYCMPIILAIFLKNQTSEVKKS